MSSSLLQNFTLDQLSSNDPAMQRCLVMARQAAASDLPVLLLGETGTGKTLLAQAIHHSSARRKKAFISFNASAMSETLLESQLFGHQKGAFTGATGTMRGKFELADGGSLFFDEIADMSSLAQAKILRAVEYGEYEPVGAEALRHADVRILSATNRPVRRLIAEGRFREDLYHRLNGLTLVIPPLRERQSDLVSLIVWELRECAAKAGKEITGIHPQALDKLRDYSWPGNLRELHRVIQTVVLFTEGDVVLPESILFEEAYSPGMVSSASSEADAASQTSFPPSVRENSIPADSLATGAPVSDPRLDAAIARHIWLVFQQADRKKKRTAELLGITRSTLDRWLRRIRNNEI